MEIKNINGHYEMYIDGKFVGSFDTMAEALDEANNIANAILKEEESSWEK